MKSTLAVTLLLFGGALMQRAPFAGKRPIGYPEMEPTPAEDLGNRFGNGENTTTERLPVEALGDRDLVNRLSKLPLDKQPFWFLNWKALEEHRNNPQTYQQRPNSFVNSLQPNFNNVPNAQSQPNFSNVPNVQPQPNFGNMAQMQPSFSNNQNTRSQTSRNNLPNTQSPPNFGNMPNTQSNFGNMPNIQSQPNFSNMPNIQLPPNFGNMPNTQLPPNFGNMPNTQLPPNFGNMPNTQSQPNFGNMPSNQPMFHNGPNTKIQSRFTNAQSTKSQPNYRDTTMPNSFVKPHNNQQYKPEYYPYVNSHYHSIPMMI